MIKKLVYVEIEERKRIKEKLDYHRDLVVNKIGIKFPENYYFNNNGRFSGADVLHIHKRGRFGNKDIGAMYFKPDFKIIFYKKKEFLLVSKAIKECKHKIEVHLFESL